MKLAEALALRADMQKRLGQLSGRIVRHARHQEGETPPEDSAELLAEYDRIAIELEAIIVRINAQNLRMSEGAGTPRGIERHVGRKLRHSSPQAQPRADALIATAP